MTGLLRLATAGALVDAAGGDRFLASELDPIATFRAYAVPGAAGWAGWRDHARPSWVTLVGEPRAAAELAAGVVEDLVVQDGRRPAGMTLPRGAWELLPAGLRADTTDWDWFWTSTAPPPLPGEELVDWLDDGDEVAAEITALLDSSSPRRSATPEDPEVLRWAGLREPDGTLVATAAHTAHGAGVPHLASIATRPDRRGRGFGGAVTAWLTRQLLAEHAWVTLGMYADNDPARRIYRRLGWRQEHRFASGRYPTD